MTKRIPKKILVGIAVGSCAIALLLYFFPIKLFADEFRQKNFENILRYGFCCIATICLLLYLKIDLFSKPTHLIALIPCLIIAIDNFPFYSYFQGNMHFLKSGIPDFVLFGAYCLCVGIFEESIFRGIVFSVVAERLPQNKKGFILTYLVSSCLFGVAHLFNLFAGAGFVATLMQVGYTTLTGGLFAFALIKTGNVLCSGFIHGLYNFCGLLLSEQGLGSGIVFDAGTTIIMAIVSVAVGIYVLYAVYTYPETERQNLYKKMGIKQ